MVPQQHRRRRRRAALIRSERRLIVSRGVGGFGFTIAGQRPCVVSAVATGGSAERAGLRAGDAIISVDGNNVTRAPHAAVARLIATAPQAISMSVALRDSQPTDTEDTEPDERVRTRRRHPPPRRRPHQPPVMHHPGCHPTPSTSGHNEIHNMVRPALNQSANIARLECRAVIGYLGTIETPKANETPPSCVKTAVRKLRQERRSATPVLLSVLPNALLLRRPNRQVLAQYPRERIVFASCSSDSDRRYFGLVTSSSNVEADSHSCHVFAVDPRLGDHEAHTSRAAEFQINCTRDPVAERCLEFPPSSEYVVGVIKGMYSLPADDCSSPALQQISKLAIKGDSPSVANFSRNNRAGLRMRVGRRDRNDDLRVEGDVVANSPQPSNHSEITTTSSNSDSGIGFHNDGWNVADRILVVDFGNQQPLNYRCEVPRPVGMVGNFEDGLFLSNSMPVVDGFAGQGRPLNHLDDVMLNNLPGVPGTSKDYDYEDNLYENVPLKSEENGNEYDDRIAESIGSFEMYEEKSVEAASYETAQLNHDTISVYSTRSHEEPRPRMRHLQSSLDDMLVIGARDEHKNDDDKFLHPASVKCKVRKNRPLNLLTKTRNMFSSKDKDEKKRKESRDRAMSASAGDNVGDTNGDDSAIYGASSEPDLRGTEQSSPFRRWTTSTGSGSSYRHHDLRNLYTKQQMSEGASVSETSTSGGVARWSLGLEQLLSDPAGAAAFAHFLNNEFAAENIRFWWSCEQYKKQSDSSTRSQLAKEIWSRHLSEGASEPVNVDAAARRATALQMDESPVDLFAQAQKQIFNVMKFDSYPRFLRSPIHAECARADLRGLPTPFENNNQEHKLKKSASNASERRRSGSLLPWRSRTVSKDRANNNTTNTLDNEEKVNATEPSSCSLCRVLLPGGASSVVGVSASSSVQQLVQKLLDKRSIQARAYDVMLDDPQGESRTISPSTCSLALGGRCIRVLVRSCVRLLVRGHRSLWVSVRCRPNVPLSRALHHVMHKYMPGLTLDDVVVIKDGKAVDVNLEMKELDGSRLQLVSLNDNETVSGIEPTHAEEDLDSLNDLAVRLHEDCDNQSGSSDSTSSRNGQNGRVRAALKNGPSIHHPPDFLDNLREKQRIRLQNEVGIPKTRIESRTPPPLPPKPRALQAPAIV